MRKLYTIIAALLLLVAGIVIAEVGNYEATVSTSGTSATTGALSSGWKMVYCTVDTHYRIAPNAATAVATTDDLTIPANTAWQTRISPGLRYLAFILAGGTGTCKVYRRNVDVNAKSSPLVHLSHPVNGTVIAPSQVDISGTLGVGGAATFGSDVSASNFDGGTFVGIFSTRASGGGGLVLNGSDSICAPSDSCAQTLYLDGTTWTVGNDLKVGTDGIGTLTVSDLLTTDQISLAATKGAIACDSSLIGRQVARVVSGVYYWYVCDGVSWWSTVSVGLEERMLSTRANTNAVPRGATMGGWNPTVPGTITRAEVLPITAGGGAGNAHWTVQKHRTDGGLENICTIQTACTAANTVTPTNYTCAGAYNPWTDGVSSVTIGYDGGCNVGNTPDTRVVLVGKRGIGTLPDGD